MSRMIVADFNQFIGRKATEMSYFLGRTVMWLVSSIVYSLEKSTNRKSTKPVYLFLVIIASGWKNCVKQREKLTCARAQLVKSNVWNFRRKKGKATLLTRARHGPHQQ